MKGYSFKPSARPPDVDETVLLDTIASEILKNFVLKGKLAPLTPTQIEHYETSYALRKPSTESHYS
jgi:hypothetical protein